ncbi:hypothetical protein ADJ70_06530 [Olsenella sp. oral taxon 807]|nr:hypothetical protein ADJ70_06530 [Olsenella sp. oral taxon 807]
MGSLRVVAVACLCVVVAAAAVQFGPYFIRMLKLYQEGPSIGAALNSPAVQIDRKLHGTTYNFLYEDRDEAGRVRYHFVSNSGGNIPLVITCEFHWFDSWGFLEFYPAGWNYVCSNPEEWVDAYDAWGSGQGYGIPIR